jgi:hypothetical protein
MDKFTEIIKKSAESYTLMPSSRIWERIELKINKHQRNRKLIIFSFLFAGIFILGIFLFNYHSSFFKTKTTIQKKNTLSTMNGTTKQNNSKTNIKKTIINSTSLPLSGKMDKQNNNENSKKRKLDSYSVLSSNANNENEIVRQTTAIQNNQLLNYSEQIQVADSISTTISSINKDSIKYIPDNKIANHIKQDQTKRDLTITLKSDTIKKDSLILKKSIEISTNDNRKWSIGIGISPTISYSNQKEKDVYQLISKYRDSSDKNILTWNFHVAIAYKFLPQWDLISGLGIINFQQKILSKQSVYDTNINYNPAQVLRFKRGYFNINGDSTGTIKNKLSYLEIPFGIRYNFLPNRKFNIMIQPVICFNKLIHSEGYIYNYQSYTYQKMTVSDFKSWIISYGVELSFQYEIQKNLYLDFTPFYNNFQKSICQASYPVNQYLRQFEYRFSICYLIK